MVEENKEKNVVYTSYGGDVEDLIQCFKQFCGDEYGDECEFGKVTVEREKDGGSWKLHQFDGLTGDAVKAFENHLRAPTDIVRIRFGSSEEDDGVEFIVAKPGNTATISRYVKKDDLEEVDGDQLIILAIEDSEEERHRKFIQSIS